MNSLFKLRKNMAITGLVPFKYLLYAALLTKVTSFEPEDSDEKFGVFSENISDLYDYFPEFNSKKNNEIDKALDDLADEGLISFDAENPELIYLGEFRGRKFFTFEVKSSLFEEAKQKLDDAIKAYGKSRSAKDKSRSRYIREQIDKLLAEKGVEAFTPNDFTDLHSYLYEMYTGGEVYIIRSKVEYFQTNNMLKAYDRFTVFAILIEGTLNYDEYSTRGVPTLTNVAYRKDDIFRKLTRTDSDSKDYMREMDTTDGSF